MTRYDLYTALIGILSVVFTLVIFLGDLFVVPKIFLMGVGVIIFVHSAYTLYCTLKYGDAATPSFLWGKNRTISKISLLNKKNEVIQTWELYGKTSAIIGKDIGENHVDIDLGKTPYASMIDIEHAVINYANGSWYIEDLDSSNGISVKKLGQNKTYKLSALQPCKLDFGDIIFVGVCQLKLN